MIIRVIIASVVVAAPAAFAAGYWESQHQGDVPVTVGVRLNAPILTKPGSGSAEAAKYLAVLNTPPPPPPPGAQPPDVGLTFRREVTAVTTDRTPHVILADGRQLARGQDYRDGWKVRQITTESVTLAKGAETRSINLFSAPAGAATIQAPPGFAGVGGFGQISLTNGERPGQLNAGAINRILDALKVMGLTQAQLDQLRRTLTTSGSLSQQQAMQMINTALRGRTATRAQIASLVQAFASAGVIRPDAAAGLSQQLFAQQQNQQLQGISGGGGRPNVGGRPGFGGPGGRRGGPLGLTPPNVVPPGAPPAAVQAVPAPAAPDLAPTAQGEEDDLSLRLAQLAGQSHQDEARAL